MNDDRWTLLPWRAPALCLCWNPGSLVCYAGHSKTNHVGEPEILDWLPLLLVAAMCSRSFLSKGACCIWQETQRKKNILIFRWRWVDEITLLTEHSACIDSLRGTHHSHRSRHNDYGAYRLQPQITRQVNLPRVGIERSRTGNLLVKCGLPVHMPDK